MDVNDFMIKHLGTFKDKAGCSKDFMVKLQIKPRKKPIIFQATTMLFALRDKIKLELDRLGFEGEGIITMGNANYPNC